VIFIETPLFTKLIKDLLPDDDYRLLQQTILLLLPYKKGKQKNLTPAQLKVLRKLIKERLR